MESARLPSRQDIGRPVPAKSVGTKTVAGQPSRARIGSASPITDLKASSNVTATALPPEDAVTASVNVTPR